MSVAVRAMRRLEAAFTDTWRTALAREVHDGGAYARQKPYEGAGRSGL
jgi:hypothetical protein